MLNYLNLLTGIYKKILPNTQTKIMLTPKHKPKLVDQIEMFGPMVP